MFGQIPGTPEQYGWLLVLCWLIYQVYAPKMGITTRLSALITEVKEALDDLRGRIRNIEQRQENHIQVTRAQARIHPEMDEEEVDEYLVENGIDPDDFINARQSPSETSDD
jgi:hypothetical protein